MSRDVKDSTVETMTKRLIDHNPKLTVEQAKKVATESAERVNRRRREEK